MDFFFNWLFKGLDSYFNHEIHYEKDNYDFENKNYIKILMPHGIIPYSYFCIKGNRNNKLFNKKRDKLAIMHQFFNFPLSYFCGKILNVIPSKYYDMENIIKNNKSLIVYLGGVRETFSASEKDEILYIKKRRGIFRLALENNTPLLPIYTFGITQLYKKSEVELIIPFFC